MHFGCRENRHFALNLFTFLSHLFAAYNTPKRHTEQQKQSKKNSSLFRIRLNSFSAALQALSLTLSRTLVARQFVVNFNCELLLIAVAGAAVAAAATAAAAAAAGFVARGSLALCLLCFRSFCYSHATERNGRGTQDEKLKHATHSALPLLLLLSLSLSLSPLCSAASLVRSLEFDFGYFFFDFSFNFCFCFCFSFNFNFDINFDFSFDFNFVLGSARSSSSRHLLSAAGDALLNASNC